MASPLPMVELPADAVAGITIWGLLIPEMIAYAGLAGLPPEAGLYTLLASLVVYAVFGGSRQLVAAGTPASAVLVLSAVTALGPHDAKTYATLASGCIVLTGLIFVAAGLLKLGFITEFLSRPVMAGFVFGLAIFVTVSQLPKLFGLKKGDGDTIRQLAHVLANLGSTSLTTLAVGATALIMLFALERYLPRIPGGLVVLVSGIAISAAADLSSHGVETVGKIPTGLPSAITQHLQVSQPWVLLPSALGMMLVIFSEALGAGQTFADKHGYRIDSSQEMIALGLANIGSGFLGGLACGGSLSQTAVNDGAGARSELSAVVAAAFSLVTVVALTPLFKDARGGAGRLDHPRCVASDEGRRDATLLPAGSPGILAGDADARRGHHPRRPPWSHHRRRVVHSATRVPGQPATPLRPRNRPGGARSLC
ncbi:MAG TPA: SulP family inorganic anion transporter [Acidimicrobiales bacterium]